MINKIHTVSVGTQAALLQRRTKELIRQGLKCKEAEEEAEQYILAMAEEFSQREQLLLSAAALDHVLKNHRIKNHRIRNPGFPRVCDN